MTAAGLVRTASARIDRADAEFIAAHLLGLKRHEIHLDSRPVSEDAARRFVEMADEVATGRPVQYVTHSAPFLDFELYVDERVLIPRPETEELVTRAAARVSALFKVVRPTAPVFLDFGTGSGCIAIALTRMFEHVQVLAVDSSADALDVCRRNIARFGLEGRISLLAAQDLGHPSLRGLAGSVDLLISNPPYIPSASIRQLDPKVRDHEPRLALDGGPKGINILSMLVNGGPELARHPGIIALEIDPGQSADLLWIAPAGQVEKDLSGRDRYFFLNC